MSELTSSFSNIFSKDYGKTKLLGASDPFASLNSGFTAPSTEVSAFTTPDFSNQSAEGSKLFGLDTGQLGNIASLGSVAVSAFGAYDQYKTNKLAREGMKFNLASARESLARFKQSREGFNNFDSSATRIA